jgi:hypothetical protein
VIGALPPYKPAQVQNYEMLARMGDSNRAHLQIKPPVGRAYRRLGLGKLSARSSN